MNSFFYLSFDLPVESL